MLDYCSKVGLSGNYTKRNSKGFQLPKMNFTFFYFCNPVWIIYDTVKYRNKLYFSHRKKCNPGIAILQIIVLRLVMTETVNDTVLEK